MLLLFGFLFVLLGITIAFLIPTLWAREVHARYAAPRAVTCPETHRQVGVTIDADHAAATALRGKPEFRLADCTRWPEKIHCAQDCLPEALRNEPDTLGEAHPAKPKEHIYHPPVLLAAFAAWYVGMLWHSSYLFRARWMADLDLTADQWRQLVSWYSPHVLSVAACLLFAYGAAWLQATLFRAAGVGRGIVSSMVLWGAVLVVTLPSTINLPRDLFLIEASYTAFAALVVGAIIGGLSGKMLLEPEGK